MYERSYAHHLDDLDNMLGAQQIVIGQENFLRGMSTSREVSDGGFSPETVGLNLLVTPGLIRNSVNTVDSDTDTVLGGDILASAPDHQTAGTDPRAIVTGDRKYFRYNGTKLGSALTTDTDNAVGNYAKGFVDMVQYKGATFTTLKNNIVKWSGASTFDTTFKASDFTNVADMHPALVFEDNLFYGDGNLLRRQTTATDTTIATILTLPSDDHIIALGIDRGTGKMLISTTSTFNVSNTLTAIHKLHWYDGFSNKVSKVVHVDDMITAFYGIGNTVYVGYGLNLGVISGSGIRFLRKLNEVTLAVSQLPYKQNFTNIGSTLYVVDGDRILAYGPILSGGPNVFYYLYKNDITSDADFDTIFYAGNNKIGFNCATNIFHTLDTSSLADTSTGSIFQSNWYYFPRPVIIRKAIMEFAENADDSTPNVNTSNVNLQYKYNDGTVRTSIVEGGNYTGGRDIQHIVSFIPTPTTTFRFITGVQSQNVGIRKIIIYYDFVE